MDWGTGTSTEKPFLDRASTPRFKKGTTVVGVLLIAVSVAALLWQPVPSSISEVPVTAVLTAADAGQVAKVSMPPGSLYATATVTGGEYVGQDVRFAVLDSARDSVTSQLFAAGVVVDFGPRSGSERQFGLPFASGPSWPFNSYPAIVVLLMVQAVMGGIGLILFAVLSSHPKAASSTVGAKSTPVTDIPTVRFSDVQGATEAVQQVSEMSHYLQDPDKYTKLGAKLPGGCLLVGPPGTGKTMLAKALAGECGVPVFATSGSDFVEVFVGTGPKRIRELYQQARSAGKAIVFIDEIDALARKRVEVASVSGAYESENTLLALLAELDGFHEGSSVITIAATNRPDVLDPALTRPGRLDRRVEVPLPDRRGRESILNVHATGVPLDEEVSLEYVARNTPGFSGAQLQQVVNEAALRAAHRDAARVSMEDFAASIATVAMGRPRHSALITENDRRITAWHEAGHAVCALLLDRADDPVAVTIVPRGQAGGLTWMEGTDDQFLTRSRAYSRMVVAMGGRCAEEMELGNDFTQGAASDLAQATETAWAMVTQFGMTKVGLSSRSGSLASTNSDASATVVEELLRNARKQATELLTTHRELLEAVATALLVEESLAREHLIAIAESLGVAPSSVPVRLDEYSLPCS